jgi:hypothetical protein
MEYLICRVIWNENNIIEGDLLIDALIETLFNDTTMSPHEVTELINILIYKISKQGRSFADELKKSLYDFCKNKRICPVCAGELTTRTIPGDQSDCRGVLVTEEWDEWYCNECGWVDDKE